jgi:transposase
LGTYKKIEVIGIDEISLKKGHKDYVTIITGLEADNLLILGVLEGRKKAPLKSFLKEIPAKIRRNVETVCVDLYDGFINAAKEVFPSKTKITADRFHVAKLYRGSFDKLRKKEMKRLGKTLSDNDYKLLKGVMWTLRRNKETLTLENKQQLDLLFNHSPKLKEAYDLMNELTGIFNKDINRFHGKHHINGWIGKVQRSKVTCFDTFIKTMNKFKHEITNYFVDKRSSGFVEGLNNKIKVIKRRCYGILNKDHLFQRIYLDISGYARFLR